MNSIQQQHLQQMGIPVWRLREPENRPVAQTSSNTQMVSISWQGQTVGSCLADHDADQTLLEAMLNATQCEWSYSDADHDKHSGLTLIFGLNLAQIELPTLNLSEASLGTLQALDSNPVIITHAVNAIAADPSLKKPAWETLKIAIAYWKK